MARYRIEFDDTRGGEHEPSRLRSMLKTMLRHHGFRAGPLLVLDGAAPTPAQLAGVMVQVVETDRSWDLYWITPSGSRIALLDEVFDHAELPARQEFWRDVLAKLLELGGRQALSGRMEVSL